MFYPILFIIVITFVICYFYINHYFWDVRQYYLDVHGLDEAMIETNSPNYLITSFYSQNSNQNAQLPDIKID